MLVELEPFLEMMGVEAQDHGDSVIVGGFPLAVQVWAGHRMVHLRDLVDAAGLKLSSTPALGVIDVRLPTAGLGDKGDWDAISSPDFPRASGSEAVTRIEGPVFSVNIPSRLKVLVDKSYLQSEESSSAIAADLTPYSMPGTQTVAVVAAGKDITRGMLAVTVFPGLPEKVTSTNEGFIVETMKNEFLRGEAEQIGPLSSTTVAGARFHRLRVRTTEDGEQIDSEYNFHFSNKHQLVVMIMIRAPKSQFHRVAPQLHLVLTNFRMK